MHTLEIIAPNTTCIIRAQLQHCTATPYWLLDHDLENLHFTRN